MDDEHMPAAEDQPPGPVIHNPLPPALQEIEAAEQQEAVQDDAAAAAAAAVAAGENDLEGLTVDEGVRKIHHAQLGQAALIATMQSTIDSLAARQGVLEAELRDLRAGRWVVPTSPRRGTKREAVKDGATAEALLSVSAAAGTEVVTNDAEVDGIMDARRRDKAWPVKRKFCVAFTTEDDLLKIRLHRSERHHHKSVRIPKVDKHETDGLGIGNKEGRLICRLCSGKAINRNTSWMCSTCCVPLCTDTTQGDPESSCHQRWHTCRDLVGMNRQLNNALRARRESKKRTKLEMEEDGGMDAQEAAHAAAEAGLHHEVAGMAPPELPPHETVKMEAAEEEAVEVEVGEPVLENNPISQDPVPPVDV